MDTGSGNADWADGAHGFVHLSLPRGGGERELGGGVYAKRSPGRAEREWWEMARIGRRVVVCGSSLRPQEKRMKRACIVRVITPNHPENG